MSYDSTIDSAVRRLQAELKLEPKHIDGAWGGTSQKALLASGMKLDLDFDLLRKRVGGFTQSQVDGYNSLLAAINSHKDTFDNSDLPALSDAINPLYAAYILATTYHETAKKMKAIAEYGAGKSRRYGKWYTNSKGERYGHRNSNYEYYLESDYPHLYFGRGLPQLTWLDNYLKMGEILGVDLANNPELALNQDISAALMIEGMLRGSFTGLSLKRCIRYGSYGEFVYSRRIINGTDKDDLIAKYAVWFLECLSIVSA